MPPIRRRFEQLAALDKTIHEPARLAILTALSACRRAQFRYLLAITGLTPGNLSMHLMKLERKALIEIEKGFAGQVPDNIGPSDRCWTRGDRAALAAAARPEQAAKRLDVADPTTI